MLFCQFLNTFEVANLKQQVQYFHHTSIPEADETINNSILICFYKRLNSTKVVLVYLMSFFADAGSISRTLKPGTVLFISKS